MYFVVYYVSGVHDIMKFYACGSIHVERYILCQKPGYAVAYITQ